MVVYLNPDWVKSLWLPLSSPVSGPPVESKLYDTEFHNAYVIACADPYAQSLYINSEKFSSKVLCIFTKADREYNRIYVPMTFGMDLLCIALDKSANKPNVM